MKSSIIPEEAAQDPAEPVSALTGLAKRLLLMQLRKISRGRLRFIDEDLDQSFGRASPDAPYDVTVRIRNQRMYAEAVFAGTVGAGEAYIRGYWTCDNLTDLVRLFIANDAMMADVDTGWSRLAGVLMKAAHWLNRNDKPG